MQKVACDANAIKKLSEIILKAKSPLMHSTRSDEFSAHHADKLKEVTGLTIPPANYY
jgi:hypothetical protein